MISLLALQIASAATVNLQSRDARRVDSAIRAGAQACGAGDPAGAMAAVDRELVLSYPGVADMGYDELAAAYRRLCDGKSQGTVKSTVPEFEELTVIGDIAVARIIWSTHLRGMPSGTVRRLRDFQVWRKTSIGWRFWRGVHWPHGTGAAK